jgi:hypothetical protein
MKGVSIDIEKECFYSDLLVLLADLGQNRLVKKWRSYFIDFVRKNVKNRELKTLIR